MAFITLNTQKLKQNYDHLDRVFSARNIEWSVVAKLLCGNRLYLEQVLNLGVKQICDSRITNLKMIKSLNPEVETVFIKPPSRRSVKNVVRYADVSFNTEFET